MTYIVQPPRVKYEVFSFCLIFLVWFEFSMSDFIPKLVYELRLLRVYPREHQAVVLHAISLILMKLCQLKGSTPKLEQTNWFLFWFFPGGHRLAPGFSWLSPRKSLQNRIITHPFISENHQKNVWALPYFCFGCLLKSATDKFLSTTPVTQFWL